MTKVAVLDDWQGIARSSTDWSSLMGRAEVVFFEDAFKDEDGAPKATVALRRIFYVM